MRVCVGLIALSACVPIEQELFWEVDHFERVFLGLGDDTIPTVEIQVGPPYDKALSKMPFDWVPAELALEGEVHPVQIRLKGQGSFEPFEARPSLKVKFDEDWYGYRDLVFNNYASDTSGIHERLATDVFHSVGLPAARAGHAQVVLNEVERGVYGVLEDVDGDMLRRWFPRSDGTLFEMEDADFREGLLDGFEHEDGPDDRTILTEIAIALSTGDVTGFELAVQYFDYDQFLRYWATVVVVGQTDAFPYSDPGDDAYLYLEPEARQFHFLPHGLDEAFFPRGRTINRSNGLLARRCLTNADCAAGLAQAIDDVFSELRDGGFGARVEATIQYSWQWLDGAEIESMQRHHDALRDWLRVRRAQLDEEVF